MVQVRPRSERVTVYLPELARIRPGESAIGSLIENKINIETATWMHSCYPTDVELRQFMVELIHAVLYSDTGYGAATPQFVIKPVLETTYMARSTTGATFVMHICKTLPMMRPITEAMVQYVRLGSDDDELPDNRAAFVATAFHQLSGLSMLLYDTLCDSPGALPLALMKDRGDYEHYWQQTHGGTSEWDWIVHPGQRHMVFAPAFKDAAAVTAEKSVFPIQSQ